MRICSFMRGPPNRCGIQGELMCYPGRRFSKMAPRVCFPSPGVHPTAPQMTNKVPPPATPRPEAARKRWMWLDRSKGGQN